MNKNAVNLKFGIGSIFSNSNNNSIANVNIRNSNSIASAKNNDSTDFSACLLKLGENRTDNSAAQSGRISNNVSKRPAKKSENLNDNNNDLVSLDKINDFGDSKTNTLTSVEDNTSEEIQITDEDLDDASGDASGLAVDDEAVSFENFPETAQYIAGAAVTAIDAANVSDSLVNTEDMTDEADIGVKSVDVVFNVGVNTDSNFELNMKDYDTNKELVQTDVSGKGEFILSEETDMNVPVDENIVSTDNDSRVLDPRNVSAYVPEIVSENVQSVPTKSTLWQADGVELDNADAGAAVANLRENIVENTGVSDLTGFDNLTQAYDNDMNLNNDKNLVKLDENLATDIVSAKFDLESETNVSSVSVEAAVESFSAVRQTATIGEVKERVEVNETKETEVKFDVNPNGVEERSEDIVRLENKPRTSEDDGEEFNSSNLGDFESAIDDEAVKNEEDKTVFEPTAHLNLNTKVEVGNVNLQNAATRQADAAEAVQNYITQNTSDIIGQVGTKTMELTLNPQELGKIVIRMQSTAEGLNIKISADNIDINKGLEMRIFQIENTLKTQGVTLNNIEIEHSSVSDNSSGFDGFGEFESPQRQFDEFSRQNRSRDGNSEDGYIEYSYDDNEETLVSSISSGMWQIGNSNVEFLA